VLKINTTTPQYSKKLQHNNFEMLLHSDIENMLLHAQRSWNVEVTAWNLGICCSIEMWLLRELKKLLHAQQFWNVTAQQYWMYCTAIILKCYCKEILECYCTSIWNFLSIEILLHGWHSKIEMLLYSYNFYFEILLHCRTLLKSDCIIFFKQLLSSPLNRQCAYEKQ